MRRLLLLFVGALVAILLLTTMRPGAQAPATKPSLAERLGFAASDIILIVNADDVGMSHASNVATRTGMEKGLITSGTIMVPCPWFEEIAAYATSNPKADFGLHLTHTSEWKVYKWGPVANKADVPGLVTPQGYLWPDIGPIYKNATPEQAEIEARAQIRKALDRGIDRSMRAIPDRGAAVAAELVLADGGHIELGAAALAGDELHDPSSAFEP